MDRWLLISSFPHVSCTQRIICLVLTLGTKAGKAASNTTILKICHRRQKRHRRRDGYKETPVPSSASQHHQHHQHCQPSKIFQLDTSALSQYSRVPPPHTPRMSIRSTLPVIAAVATTALAMPLERRQISYNAVCDAARTPEFNDCKRFLLGHNRRCLIPTLGQVNFDNINSVSGGDASYMWPLRKLYRPLARYYVV